MSDSATIPTIASLLLARVEDDRPGYLFEDESYTWAEVVAESLHRAAVISDRLDAARPPHVGVLLENEPEYLFWLGGAALCGATVVGINPTRRGAELVRDITHTDCQFVVTGDAYRNLLPDDVGVPVLDTASVPSEMSGETALPSMSAPGTTLMLMLTSGSTSAPKAVPCSTGRAAAAGMRVAAGFGIVDDDVCYCPMPLFHGNAVLACWAPALAVGATVVLRRKFSASEFIDDVRRYDCTYFTYVGRTVSYVLGQAERPDDADCTLRLGFGTEASALDRARFESRFACRLVEGYGSSESGIVLARTPDTPAAALGMVRDPENDVAVVDATTATECPRASFDEDGALVNGDVAIGELVNRSGGAGFTGYYGNPDATANRLRDGWFWSGDLSYRDELGYFYFAGRDDDRLRVDGENFSTEPVAEILARLPSVAGVAVYAVPDEVPGDQVMAAIEVRPGADFDPVTFRRSLGAHNDLGTKWAPRFIRIVGALPTTANNKVLKSGLRSEGFVCADPVWWSPERDADYELLDGEALAWLRARYAHHGRGSLIPAENTMARSAAYE